MKTNLTSIASRISLAGLLVIVMLTMAACGNQSGKSTVVHVNMTEYKVEMDKTSIPAGPVRFEIKMRVTPYMNLSWNLPEL